MEKLTALRQQLLATVPHLQRAPDRLQTSVEKGTIEFAPGPSLSHGYTFTAQMVMTDFSDDLDTVMIPLLDWLADHQPDLVPAEAVRFELEESDGSAADLTLHVQLTERVVAHKDCDSGQIHVDHRLPRLEREECPSDHWQLLIRDNASEEYTLVAEWDGPKGNRDG